MKAAKCILHSFLVTALPLVAADFSVNDDIHHICNNYSSSDRNLLESQSAEELLACGAEQK